MDVKLTVIEVEGKTGMFASKDATYRAAASVVVSGRTLSGLGEHPHQEVAEALAVADLKNEYRFAFPPVKTVVTKTLSVDLDA